VRFAEITLREVERNRSLKIFKLSAECVRRLTISLC